MYSITWRKRIIARENLKNHISVLINKLQVSWQGKRTRLKSRQLNLRPDSDAVSGKIRYISSGRCSKELYANSPLLISLPTHPTSSILSSWSSTTTTLSVDSSLRSYAVAICKKFSKMRAKASVRWRRRCHRFRIATQTLVGTPNRASHRWTA